MPFKPKFEWGDLVQYQQASRGSQHSDSKPQHSSEVRAAPHKVSIMSSWLQFVVTHKDLLRLAH